MKKLFTLVLCAFAAIAVNAKFVVTFSDEGKTATIVSDATDFNSYLNNSNDMVDESGKDVGSQVMNCTKLIFKGKFGGMNAFQNGSSAKIVDMSEAEFSEYTNNDKKYSNHTPFKYWKDTIEKAVSSKYVSPDAYLPGDITMLADCKSLKEYTINAGIPQKNANFDNTYSLQKVIIGTGVSAIGYQAFQNASTLTELVYMEPSQVKVFESYCFNKTNLSTVTIPGSATEVQDYAFGNIPALTTVVISENCGNTSENLTIRHDAFNLSQAISDVYVNTKNHIICELRAFDLKTTFNNGDPSGDIATLHFPDTEAEYFTNLNHALDVDIAKDPGLLQAWLVEHNRQAQDDPKNGFWEFVNTGALGDNDDDVVKEGKFLRTFSHPTLSHIVPQGVKAYIVNGIVKNGDHYEAQLKSIGVIPRKTGVILYGQPNSHNSKGKPILSMTIVKLSKKLPDGTVIEDGQKLGDGTIVDLSLRRENWVNLSDADMTERNYLEPTLSDDPEATFIRLQPYELENGKVKYRIFGMADYAKTTLGKDKNIHYQGFFRAKKNAKIGLGKAFLKLKASDNFDPDKNLKEVREYDLPTGMEISIPKDNNYTMRAYAKNSANDPTTYYDESEDQNGGFWKSAVWENDWGVRPKGQAYAKFVGEPFIEEDEDGNATMIFSASVEEESNGDYYNLQGQKIAHPTHGIYIKNGKKVIVK